MADSFTKAEDAFIKAAVPVHRAADQVRLAVENHTNLTNHAFGVGVAELGQEKMEDPEYVHDLLVAAAYEAGYGDDSFVVQGLHNTLQEWRGVQAAEAALPSAIELPSGVEVHDA